MGKFLIGVLTGFILTVLVFILVVVAAIRFRDKPPTVAEGSTLVLRLDGEIPERPPIELPIPFLQEHTVTVANVWGLLRRAATDSRAQSPRGGALGPGDRLGQAAGITRRHRAVQKIRQAGDCVSAQSQRPRILSGDRMQQDLHGSRRPAESQGHAH